MTQVRAILMDKDGADYDAANPVPVTGATTAALAVGGAAVSATNPVPATTSGTPGTTTATIALGASLSGEINLNGASLLGIAMPAAWDAASLTFQASATAGGTYQEVYDDLGNPVTVAVAAGRMVAVDNAALKLAPWRYLKIRSGTAAAPANQTAARAITIITK